MPTPTERRLVGEYGAKLKQAVDTVTDCYVKMMQMADESADVEFKGMTMFACGRLETVIATLQAQAQVQKEYSTSLKLEN